MLPDAVSSGRLGLVESHVRLLQQGLSRAAGDRLRPGDPDAYPHDLVRACLMTHAEFHDGLPDGLRHRPGTRRVGVGEKDHELLATFQSKPGVGTSVELWLPTAAETGLQSERAGAEVRLAAAGTGLIVDDEDIVRASTADMPSDLGYAIVEATSAEEALALIDGGLAPPVLITDHLMPGMTGTDLAQMLKERRSTLPILIIPGYAEDQGIAPDLPRLT